MDSEIVASFGAKGLRRFVPSCGLRCCNFLRLWQGVPSAVGHTRDETDPALAKKAVHQGPTQAIVYLFSCSEPAHRALGALSESINAKTFHPISAKTDRPKTQDTDTVGPANGQRSCHGRRRQCY